MKKIIFVFLLAITATSLTSCKKSGVNLFAGNYSFKTSGEVSITAVTSIDSSSLPIPASLNINLPNDIGQLDISVSDKKNDQVIVIFNYLNEDIVTTMGTCEGDEIELDEFKRSTLPVTLTTLTFNDLDIKVKGTGRIYDGDKIVFDMDYQGKVKIGSVTYKIKDKDIKMVAYRN